MEHFSKRQWLFFLLTGGAILGLVQHPALIWNLLCRVGRALLPFGLGLCLAFFLNVPLCFLEEKVFAGKKVRRGLTLTLTCLLAAGGIALLIFWILPQLRNSLAKFWEHVPAYLTRLEAWTDGLTARFGPHAEELAGHLRESLRQWTSERGSRAAESTVSMAAGLLEGTAQVLAGIVFSIYLLAGKERFCRSCQRVLDRFLPEKWAKLLAAVGKLSAQTFRRFVSGQLTEALLLGCLCFLGMAISGLPYAALISVLIGVTALVPVFGAIFGTAAGALLLLMERPAAAVWFVCFIVILQQVENNFIYPRVVGDSVGLPGIWVLLAVTAGGSLFGIAGMILGIPVVSVLYQLPSLQPEE